VLLLADDDVVVAKEVVVRLSDVVGVFDVVDDPVLGVLDIELEIDVEDEGKELEVVVPSPPIPTPSVNDDAGVSLTNE